MIFVTGDTHRSDLLSLEVFCDNHPELTKDDYVIIAGDFGGVWAKDTLERDLKPFSDLPVTVLFVDGNHEKFDLIDSYPVEEWKGGKVHKIKPDSHLLPNFEDIVDFKHWFFGHFYIDAALSDKYTALLHEVIEL